MKRRNRFFLIIGIVIIFLFSGALTTVIGKNIFFPPRSTVDTYTNWFVYQNTYCHYTIKYPYTWDIDLSQAYNKAANSCSTGSDVIFTRQGFRLEFKYLNYVPVEKVQHFDTFATQTIAGQKFTKAYIDECSVPVTPNEDCQSFNKNKITMVTYDNAADIENNFAGTSFYLKNGKIASLVLRMPDDTINPSDATFQSVDQDMDKIVASLSFE